jgi:hypothetical protein
MPGCDLVAGRSTVAIVLTEENTDDSNVRMNKVSTWTQTHLCWKGEGTRYTALSAFPSGLIRELTALGPWV